MANPVVHFEVLGRDGAKLQQFYQDAFDWKIDASNPMNYGIVDTGSEDGIAGGIAAADEPQATFYVSVDDPAATLEKIKTLGGTVVQDVTLIPGMVTMALFEDPEGNRIGIVASEPPPAE
jgi:predicted enzyme related to lactoylglutathione lyase